MYEIETQQKNKSFIPEVRIYLIKSWLIRSPIEILHSRQYFCPKFDQADDRLGNQKIFLISPYIVSFRNSCKAGEANGYWLAYIV